MNLSISVACIRRRMWHHSAVLGGTAGHRDARLGGLHLFHNGAYRPCSATGATFGQMPAALTDLKPITPCPLCPRSLRFGSYSHNQNETAFLRATATIVKSWPGYWIYHNRDDSISFGTEERDYFGWPPAEITRAVPESLINTIGSMVCHAHRMGRRSPRLPEAIRSRADARASIPHYPMNDLRKMTPPPLPPGQDT